MTIDLKKLYAPFDPNKISWRVGATNGEKTRGIALAYIDARDVMERLDEVCGPENWQSRYPHANGKTVCEIGIRIDGEWVWKANGAGDTDFEAEKGALSDAFKRSAVLWGIGRYLYDVDSPWVEIDKAGKSYSIKQGELGKLRSLLQKRAANDPAPARETVKPGSLADRASPRPLVTSGQNGRAIDTYVATFRLAVEKCEFESEIFITWQENAANRAALGIVKDDETYRKLAAICADRRRQLEALDKQAELLGAGS